MLDEELRLAQVRARPNAPCTASWSVFALSPVLVIESWGAGRYRLAGLVQLALPRDRTSPQIGVTIPIFLCCLFLCGVPVEAPYGKERYKEDGHRCGEGGQ